MKVVQKRQFKLYELSKYGIETVHIEYEVKKIVCFTICNAVFF